jgi:hypothetical protein
MFVYVLNETQLPVNMEFTYGTVLLPLITVKLEFPNILLIAIKTVKGKGSHCAKNHTI